MATDKDAEFVKMAEEREREYEITTLLDRELGLWPEPELGGDVYARACTDLRNRGIDPDRATQKELLEAMRMYSR